MNDLLKSRRRSGFTLVELVIAVSILGIVFASITQFFLNSSRAFSSAAVKTYLEARGQAVANRLVKDITAARFLSLIPPVPFLSDKVRFQKLIDVVGYDPVYGNPIQIEMVPGTQLNDVRIWEDIPPYAGVPGIEDTVVILASKVQNLDFTRLGTVLQIDITLQSQISAEGDIFTYQIVTGVKMRN